jgi:predicted outer membrane repeat protein
LSSSPPTIAQVQDCHHHAFLSPNRSTTFHANTALTAGGAIAVGDKDASRDGCSLDCRACDFWQNWAPLGAAIFSNSPRGGSIYITASCLIGNGRSGQASASIQVLGLGLSLAIDKSCFAGNDYDDIATDAGDDRTWCRPWGKDDDGDDDHEDDEDRIMGRRYSLGPTNTTIAPKDQSRHFCAFGSCPIRCSASVQYKPIDPFTGCEDDGYPNSVAPTRAPTRPPSQVRHSLIILSDITIRNIKIHLCILGVK